MNYLFDTEFLETQTAGKISIELISIGIISEDNRELYLENSDFNWQQSMSDNWLFENVKPLLAGANSPSWQTPEQMVNSIQRFIGRDDNVVFWAYVASYDFVGLMSLFGRLIERPDNWPLWCRDLKHLVEDKKIAKDKLLVQVGSLHNALEDAQWNLSCLSTMSKNKITISYRSAFLSIFNIQGFLQCLARCFCFSTS